MKDEDEGNIEETNVELAASTNDQSLTDGFDDIVTKSSNHFYENPIARICNPCPPTK